MTNLKLLIKRKRAFYKKQTPVFCNLFSNEVHFKSDGFHHLLYKTESKRRKRNVSEQIMKLHCLTYAPVIVRNATLILDARKEKKKVKKKIKTVYTYEIIDSVKRDSNIAVIIERRGNGLYRFRSVKKITDSRYKNKKAP